MLPTCPDFYLFQLEKKEKTVPIGVLLYDNQFTLFDPFPTTYTLPADSFMQLCVLFAALSNRAVLNSTQLKEVLHDIKTYQSASFSSEYADYAYMDTLFTSFLQLLYKVIKKVNLPYDSSSEEEKK